MIISENNTKTVFFTLVCVSLGALLGLEVKTSESGSVEENQKVIDADNVPDVSDTILNYK